MGWDYVQFRSFYELRRKTGLLKKRFPVDPPASSFTTLEEWRREDIPFFFRSKKTLQFPKHPDPILKKEYDQYFAGKLRYFNADFLDIGKGYDWLTNPASGYRYDINKHWTEVEDISETAGDIKFTWEKSRFSFLYMLIRYDYHFEEDTSELVFAEIDSWIKANPINQGPNYKCSQEISLRVLNWTFALYYYKDSDALTEERFNRIIHTIYWQLKHDFANIHFSRKTVRNNHAVTETLMLYLAGLLFPFFPEAKKWKQKGKQWFEEEIAYQVYEDGTFLQFSHNYHRVLIQLMTWGFYLSGIHQEKFTELTYQRAIKSLNYLFQCTAPENGELPNYGANDGALFFKLNNRPYRDYRPQLNALGYYFNQQYLFDQEDLKEDVYWLSSQVKKAPSKPSLSLKKEKIAAFENGGYYLIRESDSFSFIRCGSYRDRPSQADNLHLDIWYKGNNILRDAGTYKYNTDQKLVNYFNGTKAHNTVTLGDHDQMLKGPRFIWLHWSKAISATLQERDEAIIFEGKILAFQQKGAQIFHKRKIKKYKDQLCWEIEDQLEHDTDLPMIQYWNIGPTFKSHFVIESFDEQEQPLSPQFTTGYYSGQYGVKESTEVITFMTSLKKIKTIIQGI